MASTFAKLDGDVYRVDKREDGSFVGAFKLVNGSWEAIPGFVIPTISFEGMPISEEEVASILEGSSAVGTSSARPKNN